jgi:site-specific DNA recombinase
MNAAIYARRSPNEDTGRPEEAKSITRQKAESRAYAERKGWTVADRHVYEDDAISGKHGEDHRPGLRALLAAAESTPRPFDVVVMAKDDRLMRNQWKVAMILSRLYEADVRLFYYQEDREVKLDDASGRFMEQVRGYASEAYRESVAQHMTDALKRKAKPGHVHGGRLYGYTNVRVDGHVERRINEAEALVLRRIFQGYAETGIGFRSLAKQLNTEGVLAPRPSRATGLREGPAGWSPVTLRDALRNEHYRGVLVSHWGAETIRVERPALRIIPEDLWLAVQARRAQARRVYLRSTQGQLWGKPTNGIDSKYLLTGMAVCAVCGASLTVVSRSHGRTRVFGYRCRTAADRGPLCTNTLTLPMLLTDAAVLAYLEPVLLNPEVITEALRRTLTPDPLAESPEVQRTRLTAELTQLDHELAKLVQVILDGEAPQTVREEMTRRERRKHEIARTLSALNALRTQAPPDPDTLRPRLLALLGDWTGLASRHVSQTRQLLRKLLVGRLRFEPLGDGLVRFTGEGTLAPVLGSLHCSALPAGVAPRGLEPVFQSRPRFRQQYHMVLGHTHRRNPTRLKHTRQSSLKLSRSAATSNPGLATTGKPQPLASKQARRA